MGGDRTSRNRRRGRRGRALNTPAKLARRLRRTLVTHKDFATGRLVTRVSVHRTVAVPAGLMERCLKELERGQKLSATDKVCLLLLAQHNGLKRND